MSFEEFLKYVEGHYQKKFDELLKEKHDLTKQYDEVLSKKQKLRQPLFTKKHPFFYAVGGIGITIVLVILSYLFSNNLFPNVPNGLFVIPSSIIGGISLTAGLEIYRKFKDEKGQYSERYLNYQEEKQYLDSILNELVKKENYCNSCIEDTRRRLVSSDDITLAKECYLYLINSKDKEKKINIDEQLLDELLLSTSLPVILYKYYRGELDKYSSLSGRKRYIEGQNLDLSGKIELVKKEVEKEIRNLETKKQMDEAATLKEQSELQIPYQRIRRVERNKDNYEEEFPSIEEEEKGHHR